MERISGTTFWTRLLRREGEEWGLKTRGRWDEIGPIEDVAGEAKEEREKRLKAARDEVSWTSWEDMAREISWATEMAIQEIIQDTRNQGRFWEWRAPSPARAGCVPRALEPHRSTKHTLHEPEMGIEDVDVLGECGQRRVLEAFREKHRLAVDRERCPNCAVDAEDFRCGCMSDREILEMQQKDDRHGGSPFLVATDGGFDKENKARGIEHDCTAAAVLCVVNIKGGESDGSWQNVPLEAERWQVPVRKGGEAEGGGSGDKAVRANNRAVQSADGEIEQATDTLRLRANGEHGSRACRDRTGGAHDAA